MGLIRQITAELTLDDDEDEIAFTRATLKADPNAVDFLPMTDDWFSLVDNARAKDRQARLAEADATAARTITNFHLDNACTHFGDELYLAVGKDRNAARWIQFFSVSVSRFIKMRFDKQIQKVTGWLNPSVQDAVLDKHRANLATWSTAAADSLEKTTASVMTRAQARIAREQLAEDLTRERDGLFDALSARARERGLPRDWPKQFFRVTPRKSDHNAEGEATSPTP